MLKRIEGKGLAETAHRVRRSLGAICWYAVATHRADVDASAALKGALAPVVSNHFAAITEPGKVGELLRPMGGYTGSEPVRCALRLAPLLFVRPGELRAAGRRRCKRLFGLNRWSRFAWRLCLRLGDASESESPEDRTWRRQRKLEARLTDDGGKPKGMRWRKFERLHATVENQEAIRDEFGLPRLLGHIGRFL